VALPQICSIYKMEGRYDESKFVVKINDFIDPGSAYEIDVNDYSVNLLRKSEIPDKTFKPEDYAQDQVFFTSKDGTKVPMFIVRKKTTLSSLSSKPQAPIPTLLTAYGGFGKPSQPDFDSTNYMMAKNMNAMFVMVNIRGGGEYGEEWHQAATRDKK